MRVVVENRFKVTERKFEKATLRAVDLASRDGVRATKQAPTRYQIRGILGQTRPVKARVVGSVARGGFVNPDWREIFFEYGTLKRRRKALARPRRRNVKSGGIYPQHPMSKGRAVARKELPQHMKSQLGKVR